MNLPRCTYRIQLHENFTLKDLEEIIDYLDALGISTIYASPITRAVPGSTHGYDVTDPTSLNLELGGLEDLQRISDKLKDRRMSWLQDIVPNHMAFHSQNYRLMDVLERGNKSPYAEYFDINFQHQGFGGKLMVPFLGDHPDVCISKEEINIELTDTGMIIKTSGDSYPMSTPAYAMLRDIAGQLDMEFPEIISNWIETYSESDSSYQEWLQEKKQVFGLVNMSPDTQEKINKILGLVNGSPRWIKLILDNQFYSLCIWREVSSSINFRRFFTISSLIGTRIENEWVFNDYHSFVFDLYKKGIINGLRVDHVDGLYDPGTYLYRLRKMFGSDCYIVVEKILSDKENMPQEWPIQGTSGYDFLSFVNRLFLGSAGKEKMDECYRNLIGDVGTYEDMILESKTAVLREQMAGELHNLSRMFLSLNLGWITELEDVKELLAAWIIHLDVYRIYPDTLPLRETETETLIDSFRDALLHSPELSDQLNKLMHLFTVPDADGEKNAATVAFMRKLMQLSSALTAKGVEDTTFYTWASLISQNEVGNAPSWPGFSVDEFHQRMLDWAIHGSASINATATHDTKRGEDGRMRLNVLPWIADEWNTEVKRWFDINDSMREALNESLIPSRKEEYFIYQTMIAGWPQDLSCPDTYIERLQAAVLKSLREAKENTSWDYPDTGYEEICLDFIRKILHPEHGFIEAFRPFLAKVIEAAVPLSLAQVLIKLTAPGIPDIYQGCETWDLSYVDPDNRRPVDYARFRYALNRMNEIETSGDSDIFDYLKLEGGRGIEKLYLIRQVLQYRKRNPDLFESGTYFPLNTNNKDGYLSFARYLNGSYVLVVVPVRPFVESSGDVQVQLPNDFPKEWTELFTGQKLMCSAEDQTLTVPTGFPVSFFVSEVNKL